MAGSVAAPSARPRINLTDALLRPNPRLTLISFADLSEQDRAGLGGVATDPALHGLLRDARGTIKVVDHDSAALLASLRRRGRLPEGVSVDPETLARLVLDSVLELALPDGRFVTGSPAYELLYDVEDPPVASTKTARLSQAALRYAQRLGLDDALRLSARLYFYGRLPVTPGWTAHLPDRVAVERFLGVDRRGAAAGLLRRSWDLVELEAPNDGWFMWSRRGRRADAARRQDRFKLYVSASPDAVPAAFGAAVAAAAAHGATALKVGNDAAALLRPDKLVLYFSELEQVEAAAAQLAEELAGCPGHGVPFSCELGDRDGLLSWGVDPPRSEHRLEWQERESWRLWLTNRLALALVSARLDGGVLEPWRYALARVELEGVDTTTWAPLGDPWVDL